MSQNLSMLPSPPNQNFEYASALYNPNSNSHSNFNPNPNRKAQ